jgi:hypothetical protein
VEAQTIPALIERAEAILRMPIDYIKMDIEGAEPECLSSLPLGSFRTVKVLAMEYHPNGDKRELFASLIRQGFSCISDKSFGLNVGVAHFGRS